MNYRAGVITGVLITVAIISFISQYNSFLFPLLILNTPEKFTLSIGIRSFSLNRSDSLSL